MNKDENDDLAIEALLVKSLLISGDQEACQDQIDAFDDGASCLDEHDKQLLRGIDPLMKINESRQNNKNTVIVFPQRRDDEGLWIQAAARQKNNESFDSETQSAIEERRKEILERRQKDRDAGEH